MEVGRLRNAPQYHTGVGYTGCIMRAVCCRDAGGRAGTGAGGRHCVVVAICDTWPAGRGEARQLRTRRVVDEGEEIVAVELQRLGVLMQQRGAGVVNLVVFEAEEQLPGHADNRFQVAQRQSGAFAGLPDIRAEGAGGGYGGVSPRCHSSQRRREPVAPGHDSAADRDGGSRCRRCSRSC